MPREQSDLVDLVLLAHTPTWLDRGIGYVATFCGLALAIAALALAHTVSRRPSTLGFIVIAVVVALSALLLTAGYRLIRQRPRQRRSLFGPWVWFALSGAFLALASFMAYVIAIRAFDAKAGQALSASLLLALLCYGIGSHVQHKRLK